MTHRWICIFEQLDNRIANPDGSGTERRRKAYYCAGRFLSVVPALKETLLDNLKVLGLLPDLLAFSALSRSSWVLRK